MVVVQEEIPKNSFLRVFTVFNKDQHQSYHARTSCLQGGGGGGGGAIESFVVALNSSWKCLEAFAWLAEP